MKKLTTAILSVFFVIAIGSPVEAAKSCSKVGSMSGTQAKPLVCKLVKGKRVWQAWKSQPVIITITTAPMTVYTTTTTVPKTVQTTVTTSPVIATTTTTTTTTVSGPIETAGQYNARRSAASYLRVMAFSRSGLIKQLEYEKFSLTDATYGVDAQNADWNTQASKSAASYLKLMAFSRAGLISQLVYEGFSQSQAEYGVNSVGL